MNLPQCVILGGGGHAKVVIDCMKRSGSALPVAILDPNSSLWGKEVFGVPIRGGDDLVTALKKEGITHFVSAVGGVQNNMPRKKVFEWALNQGLVPLNLYHPSSVISDHAAMGEGSVVFAGGIINPGVAIGKNCIINTGAIIDHDCVLGDHVHIAPGAALSGNVHVGSCAHIGTGASVKQKIHIGAEAVVGAGSVVVKDVPAKTLVKGVPAR